MKKTLFFFLITILSFNANAKYRQVCNAQYMTQNGWSKIYQVEVTFMTGYEMNTATNSYRYNTSSVYATIFWGEGQASVIKLSSFLICGLETDRSCIQNAMGYLKGGDQDGDAWRICTTNYCF